MKNTKILLSLVVVLVLCTVLCACGGPEAPEVEYTLDKTEVSLEVGKTQQLTVTSSGTDAFEVKYASANKAVATVSDKGLVTAVAKGTTVITATVGDTQLKCTVKVTETAVNPDPEYTYTLSKTSETLEIGEMETLSITVTPNKTLSVAWSSDAPEVASVENGVVTALSAGTANIKAVVDGKELVCVITVVKPAPLFTLSPSGLQKLEAGKTLQLEVTSSDEDPFEVEWTSSKQDVATVSENGLVTAVSKGQAIITAKIGDVTKTCTVDVFAYEYAFESELAIDFGADAALTVTVAPEKAMELSFAVIEGTSVTVDENGAITTVALGASTIEIKDGDAVVGTCVVTVKAVFTVEEAARIHAGGTHQIAIVANPADAVATITYASNDGQIATVSDTGLITAVANGSTTIVVTIDGAEHVVNVIVSDVYATANVELLAKDSNNPIDITAGAEYWEQYIANGEVNHKQYVTAEEDIIAKSTAVDGTYLSDYAAFLSWNGGANGSTCNCGDCNKESQNGGDGGWTNGGTKAMAINVLDALITLNIDVLAGDTTIKVYTGGYNLKGRVQLKVDGELLAEGNFNNQSAHNSQCVTFNISATQPKAVVIELAMTDDYGDAGHSCISLAAVTVSGDVYQLAEAEARLVPGEEHAIVINKNGEALTEGVEYSIIEGAEYARMEGNKVVAITAGTAKVAVKADGRTRIFTVEVGYLYVAEKSVKLHVGETHKLVVASEPAGSDAVATFESNNTAVAEVAADGTITAIGNGSATITISVEGQVLTTEVRVADILASAGVESINNGKDNPLDITAGAEYWEQYINSEVNHKYYVSAQEDIITRSVTGGNIEYLPDSPVFLAWSGGANRSNCSCGNCDKDSHTAGDPGWTDRGTKSAYLKAMGEAFVLEFKLMAGQNTIKIYTGGYNIKALVTLELDGEVIATTEYNNQSQHIARLVTFDVKAKTACTVVAKILLVDNYGDPNNSGISLSAAAVMGDVYQLAEGEIRLVPGDEYDIVINKNGEALTEGVEYRIVEGDQVVRLEGGKLVAIGNGVAVIEVKAAGRSRILVANVGYDYAINAENATLKQGQTHQIVISSDPAGSTAPISYVSDNESAATVDENGLITGVGNGTAKITVTVEGETFVVDVVVTGIEVAVANRNILGEFVDLTASNVVYWEHYIWNETNPKAIENDAEDIIDIDISANGGDPGYGAHMYFTGSRGPKADSYNDAAYHKFSKGSLFTATVTVPAGTHEIRIYTGAWENTINKVSLSDGENELASYTIEKTKGGITMLVTFTVTVEEAQAFTVKLQALEGDNCRLAAIAVATPDVATPAIVAGVIRANLTGDSTYNVSDYGTLDWVKYQVEIPNGGTDNVVGKDGGTMISRNQIGDGGAWDFIGKLTWSDGTIAATDCKDGDMGDGLHNNMRWGNDKIETTVQLDSSSVTRITLFLSGWNSNYGVYLKDAQGKVVYSSAIFTARDGGSHAFIYELTTLIDEAGQYTIGLYRAGSDGNMGFSAIAIG